MIFNLTKFLHHIANSSLKYACLAQFVLSNFMYFYNIILYYTNNYIMSKSLKYVYIHQNIDSMTPIYVFSTPSFSLLTILLLKHYTFNTKSAFIFKSTKTINLSHKSKLHHSSHYYQQKFLYLHTYIYRPCHIAHHYLFHKMTLLPLLILNIPLKQFFFLYTKLTSQIEPP